MSLFYDDGHVKVESTRYIVGNKTTPINSISSVEPTKRDNGTKHYEKVIEEAYTIPAKSHPIVSFIGKTIAVILLLLLVVMIFEGGGFWDIFLAMLGCVAISAIILGFFISIFKDKEAEFIPAVTESYSKKEPDNYYVTISTISGQIDSYSSTDKSKILEIVEAINNAIISRG